MAPEVERLVVDAAAGIAFIIFCIALKKYFDKWEE